MHKWVRIITRRFHQRKAMSQNQATNDNAFWRNVHQHNVFYFAMVEMSFLKKYFLEFDKSLLQLFTIYSKYQTPDQACNFSWVSEMLAH